jgi:hypothetical protein
MRHDLAQSQAGRSIESGPESCEAEEKIGHAPRQSEGHRSELATPMTDNEVEAFVEGQY